MDHPDTQGEKRAHASRLPPAAGEVSFVPVDLERDSLGTALERGGHDRAAPTCWIWEGVVMYAGLVFRPMGEPQISAWTSAEMAADLDAAGFEVQRDSGMADWNTRFAGGRTKVERAACMRVAVARRA